MDLQHHGSVMMSSTLSNPIAGKAQCNRLRYFDLPSSTRREQLRRHRKANRRLMKMCVNGPYQNLFVIRSIIATAFPPRSLPHAAWLHFGFPLTLRMIEDMLAARGIIVTHHTIRSWAQKSGRQFAREIKQQSAGYWATNGISTNVWWPPMARSSGSGVPSIRTASYSKYWCKAAEMPRRQSVGCASR